MVAVIVVLGPLVAAALASLTWDSEGLLVPAMWFLLAVVLAALAGGLAAGLLAVAGSTVLLPLLFLDPTWTLRVDDTGELGGVLAFVIASLLLCLVLDHLQTSRQAAVEAIADRDRSLGLLDSILANAPVGFAFFDRDLRFARVNEAMADLDEEPESSHLGRSAEEVLGPAGHELAAFLREVRDTGRPILDVEIDRRRRRSGAPLHAVAGFYPVRDAAGTLTGVGVVVQDVTDRVRVESERTLLFDRVARIQAVTAGLSGAATLTEVVDVVLAQGRHVFGADEASLALADAEGITVHYESDLPEGGRTARLPLDSDSPHASVIRTGEPLLLGSRELVGARFPDVPDSIHSLAVLPLTAERRTLGAIDVGFAAERGFDPGERAFLAAVAGLLAAALERARLFEAERAARDEAERARERVAFLAEVERLPRLLPRLGVHARRHRRPRRAVAGRLVRGGVGRGRQGCGPWRCPTWIRSGRRRCASWCSATPSTPVGPTVCCGPCARASRCWCPR